MQSIGWLSFDSPLESRGTFWRRMLLADIRKKIP
jgi:hypothetical protein